MAGRGGETPSRPACAIAALPHRDRDAAPAREEGADPMRPATRLLAIGFTLALGVPARAWTDGPAFPDPNGPRAFGAGVVHRGTIYVIGGTPLGNGGDKDTPVHRLLPGAAQWTTGVFAEGQVVRQGAGVDDLGRLIVFGGADGRDPEGDPGAAYVYDPNEGQYQSIAARGAAAPLEYFAWTTDELGRVYSLGGGPGALADANQPNSTYCERYIGSSDTWQPIAPLPAGRADAAAVCDGRGHVLLIGGYDAHATTRLASVLQYDIAGDTWSAAAIPDLPIALTGMQAVLGADQRVYVLGGVSGPVGAGTVEQRVFVLDRDGLAWTSGPDMSTPRAHFAAVLDDDDFIWVMGGEDGAGGTNLVQRMFTPTCPVVSQPPAAIDAWSGSVAGFAATATGTGPFDYQWRKDGQPLADGPTGTGSTLSGTTTASLTVLDPAGADAGMYDVVVSNDCGATTSPAAALTIRETPAIPGQWEVVPLHPAWAVNESKALGIGNGRIGGWGNMPTVLPDGRTFNLDHPVVWDATTFTSSDVTPAGSIGGGIYDVEGDLLVGWFWHTWSCPGGGQMWTCAWQSAGYWTAPGMSFVEAVHNSGSEFDYVYATDGQRMVGTLAYEYQEGFYVNQAHRWNADGSGATLHFAQADDTGAGAIDGDRQYGWYRSGNSPSHAIMWNNAAGSFLDIHPAGYGSSSVAGAGDGQVVGVADSHAVLWAGGTAAQRELHPAAASTSALTAAKGGLQTGNVAGQAALWAGSPDSHVDLGAWAPAEFLSTFAEDLDIAADGTITVVGWGYNSATGRYEALLWRSVPVAGDIDGDGDVDLGDLAILLAAYNTCAGDAAYEPAADLDASGCVDLADLSVLLSHYGT